jgi:hypothetical protein
LNTKAPLQLAEKRWPPVTFKTREPSVLWSLCRYFFAASIHALNDPSVDLLLIKHETNNMNTPNLFSVQQLCEHATTTLEQQAGRWVPARPLGFQGLFLRQRLRLAWAVFTGRCDAVHWNTKPDDRQKQ